MIRSNIEFGIEFEVGQFNYEETPAELLKQALILGAVEVIIKAIVETSPRIYIDGSLKYDYEIVTSTMTYGDTEVQADWLTPLTLEMVEQEIIEFQSEGQLD